MIAKGGAPGGAKPTPDQIDVKETLAEWIASMVGVYAKGTVALYRTQAFAHFVRWDTLADIEPGLAKYIEDRLKKVTRQTVTQELRTLRAFLGWAVEKKLLPAMPVIPKVAKAKRGQRNPHRKEHETDLSPAEVEAWIAALPERSTKPHTKGPWRGRHFPVRDWFALGWETALRPATLFAVEVPRHYTPGATKLRITKDIDKAQFDREVPLTAKAQAILARHAPASGPIFGGPYDLRRYLKEAATKAGLPAHKVETVSPYDLRHARATALVDQTGNLSGTAFLLGHKQLTTTNRYAKARERHAQAMLASVAKRGSSGEDSGEGHPSTLH